MSRVLRLAPRRLGPGFSQAWHLQRRNFVVNRHYNSQSGGVSRSGLLLLPLKLAAGVAVLYGVSIWAALSYTDSAIYSIVDNHLPLGRRIIELFEESRFRDKVRARNDRFDETRSSVQPYISRTYLDDNSSAATRSTGSSSAGGSEDPLTAQHFFDAKSGTVGLRERDYLPLIQLPETNNPLVSAVSMSMNDLVSSINAAAVSEDTVLAVSRLLGQISDDITAHGGADSAGDFRDEAARMDSLVRDFELARHDYTAKSATLPQHIVAAYHKKLAQEILKSERILVNYCNHLSSQGTTASPSKRAKERTTAARSPFEFSVPSTDLLDLQMSLRLLVAALESQRMASVNLYIQGIRSAVAASAYPDKQKLLDEALSGIPVPEDVDLKAVLQDILR